MREYEDLLLTDEELEIIRPDYGQPGYRFRPENINQVHINLTDVQMKAMRDLVKYKHSQDHQVKGFIEATALCDFLNGTDLEKAVLV